MRVDTRSLNGSKINKKMSWDIAICICFKRLTISSENIARRWRQAQVASSSGIVHVKNFCTAQTLVLTIRRAIVAVILIIVVLLTVCGLVCDLRGLHRGQFDMFSGIITAVQK